MKSLVTIHESIQSIMNVLSGIRDFILKGNRSMPLKFVRLTEKFDVIEKSHYKDWVLRPNSR